MLYAHGPNGRGRWHELIAHLVATGELAAGFAASFAAATAARFVGLVHDAGKAAGEWQKRLRAVVGRNGRVGVDHKSLGVDAARARLGVVGALVVQGHHGGLMSMRSLATWLDGLDQKGQGERLRADARSSLTGLLPDVFDAEQSSLVPTWLDVSDPLAVELFTRMLFSVLVDADVLDTRMHRLALERPEVRPPADMSVLFGRFSTRREDYLRNRPESPVDEIRHEVYGACLAAAKHPPGLYRLPAPTGAAKTLASMGFALRHAAKYGKERVVVAVPFTTITEQNAAVYRQLLEVDGEDPVVLEHHSNVVPDDRDGTGWMRLAAENWDAPVVITTTVQLFESLFGRRPGKLRKLHRLANAVIVLDEVQALPHDLLPVICDGLRRLSKDYGATVLLVSATQPEVQEFTTLRDVPMLEVVPDPVRIYRALRRVRYEWWLQPRPLLAEVAAAAGREGTALMVVNTVADARRAFGELLQRAAKGTLVRHLSTAMCSAHRRDVLAEAIAALADDRHVLLAATQLIEAGVDIDFPIVFRALAPADSLQQAAGRGNRDGRLGHEGGRCVVFDPADGGMPSSYRTAIAVTRQVFGAGRADPDDLDRLRAYYAALYQALNIEGPQSRAAEITRARADLDFVTVAEKFRLIEDDTMPVVVRYGDYETRANVAAWITRLRRSAQRHEPPDVQLLRSLQPYVVSLRHQTRLRPEVDAHCEPIAGDLAEWHGYYDKYVGVNTDIPHEELFP